MKRLLLRFGLGLVLGFVCTVGVAWVQASTVSVEYSTSHISASFDERVKVTAGDVVFTDGLLWHVIYYRARGVTRCVSRAGHQSERQPIVADPRFSLIKDAKRFPSWSRIQDHPPDVDSTEYRQMSRMSIIEDARGWPLLCLRYDIRVRWIPRKDGWRVQNVVGVSCGIKIRKSEWPPPEDHYKYSMGYALPLRPIWTGFALNWLFYSVPFWILFIVPGLVRRSWRVRRGLCLQCGYDLRGSTGPICPECGWKRKGADQ